MKNNALIGRGTYDWQAGANSAVVHKFLLESGNWKELSIPNEIQVINYGKDNQYDALMCVSFNGVTDPLEYLLMQMMRLNLIPNESVTWLKDKGYFENGKINFNERFTAVKGETTNQGAYQYKVANAARNFGLIPQKMFPYADNFYDNIDPKFITKEMEELGKEFLTHFAINWEWVNAEDTEEFSKYSPLGCIGQYADGEGILDPPTANGHCMLQVFEPEEYREIDDSYWRQFKKYKKDKLQSFMAFYITPLKNNNMDNAKFLKENDTKQVRNTNTGAYGVVYHGKLMVINPERAGLYMIDRDARGLIGKTETIQINDAEWKQLPKENF